MPGPETVPVWLVGAQHAWADTGPLAPAGSQQGLHPGQPLRVVLTQSPVNREISQPQCSDAETDRQSPHLGPWGTSTSLLSPDSALGSPGAFANLHTTLPPRGSSGVHIPQSRPRGHPPCLRSWCSRRLPRASVLVSAAQSCCSFSWFCRCVRRSWARKAWISDSKLLLSDRRRCSEDVSCRAPWGGRGGQQSGPRAPWQRGPPHGVGAAGSESLTGAELLSPGAHLPLRPHTLLSLRACCAGATTTRVWTRTLSHRSRRSRTSRPRRADTLQPRAQRPQPGPRKLGNALTSEEKPVSCRLDCSVQHGGTRLFTAWNSGRKTWSTLGRKAK